MCSRIHQLGEVVISTAGRDTGNYYLIIRIVNDKYVLLADGDKKRIEHPKRKNVKHLRSTGIIVRGLAVRLANNKKIRDEDLKKILNEFDKNEEAN